MTEKETEINRGEKKEKKKDTEWYSDGERTKREWQKREIHIDM